MTDAVEEIKDPEALIKAYNKAKEDLVALRNANKELEKAKRDLAEALEARSDEQINKWRDRAVKQAAKAALEGEGIKDAERILKYVDLSGVDFDDNDALTGLDDSLSGVKSDFPELFDAKRRAGSQSVDIHASGGTTKVDPFRASIHSALKTDS